MKRVNAVFTRRAGLLLGLVRRALAEGAPGEVPEVLRELAERFGVSPVVETQALQAWRQEERVVSSSRGFAADPRRLSIIALAQAAYRLDPRPLGRSAWAA